MILSTPVKEHECVILLHGLARTNRSMKMLAETLEQEGYLTINVNYPSTQYSVEILANKVIKRALEKCLEGTKIHFVTHSMGGILVRQYLRENVIKNMGRVVMLGPPNKGSQVVDYLSRMPGFKLLNGPAGMQLGTKKDSLPNRLGSVNLDLGIIAGTCSFNPILSLMLSGLNDGKVSVENTKLQGMLDHITLPATHTFMMNNRQVVLQVKHFLENGQFDR